MAEIIQIALMLLSLILPAQHQPKAPRGYLDCAFNAEQIYQCRP